ncbi:MAG: RHS repeat-associated core domain-containing protein [Betaproteobacteria bacterium]
MAEYYNVYRDYSPEIGRYIESDPIGLTGGINTYTYVGGNPISYTDPEGKFLVGLAGAGIGAVIGAGASVAAQLIQNQGNWNCVDWSNVGWSAATGALGGLLLTTPIGTTWAGAAGIGALTNTLNYGLTNSVSDWSVGGALAAAGSGVAGGLIGGRAPNPYWFITPSPALNDLGLVAAMVAPKSLATNSAGALAGAYDYTKGTPGSGCTCK